MLVTRAEYKIVDYFDAPEVLSCPITPIPPNTDPPLQVIASLADKVHRVELRDGILNYFMGLYGGPVGQERLIAVIGGPGATAVDISPLIPKGTRISIRAMKAETIRAGELVITFLQVTT